MSKTVLLPLLLTAAVPAWAQDAASTGAEDHTLVAARSVMPRIAYRAHPDPKMNPVKVEATTFPGRIFHGAIGGLTGMLVDESILQGTSADGGPVSTVAAPNALQNLPHGLGAGGTGGAGRTPVGMGASVGGAVSRATTGIADTITGVTSRLGGGP